MSSELDPLIAARRAIDRRRRRERRQRRRARRMRVRVAWAVAYVAVLNAAAWFSLETPAELLTVDYMLNPDKVEHMLVFFAAAVVAIPVLGRWISGGILAVLLMNAGLVIEMIQAFDPGRSADIADFAFDQIGVALGWLVSIPIRRRLQREQQAGSVPARTA